MPEVNHDGLLWLVFAVLELEGVWGGKAMTQHRELAGGGVSSLVDGVQHLRVAILFVHLGPQVFGAFGPLQDPDQVSQLRGQLLLSLSFVLSECGRLVRRVCYKNSNYIFNREILNYPVYLS